MLTVHSDPDTQLEFFAGGLPRLRGYGEVAHLHIAASVDHELFAQAFALTLDDFTDLATSRAGVEALLYRWAGTEAVPLDSRGGQVDSRKLETLEAFTGLPFEHTGGGFYMGQHVSAAIDAVFDDLVGIYAARFAVNGPFAHLEPLSYDPLTDTIQGDPVGLVDAFAADALAQGQDAPLYWLERFSLVDLLAASVEGAAGTYDVALAQALSSAGVPVGLAELRSRASEIVIGTASGETLGGSDGKDILVGGAGDDRLEGGDDADTYLFGRGYGRDTVYDRQTSFSAVDPDKVAFTVDVAPGDLVMSR